MSFPNKEARTTCWNHRDDYWKCLDEGKTNEECNEFRKKYEKFCPAQWVKHFDRKREYLKFKEQIEKGGTRSLDGRNDVPEKPDLPMQASSKSVYGLQPANADLYE